jgi:hypothetical protein
VDICPGGIDGIARFGGFRVVAKLACRKSKSGGGDKQVIKNICLMMMFYPAYLFIFAVILD